MKLVTWNIQWGRGADGRVDLDRIVAHARRFADFDVLCLQEVSAGYPELPACDGEDQFAALARRLPDFARIDGVATDTPDPRGGRRRFGNMILSRLPVRQVFRHLLPWPADASCESMQRIALEATVQTPFGALRVTPTHLEYYSPRQRAAQVERVRELHAEGTAQARAPRPGGADTGPFEHVRRGVPALIAGDFNCEPDSAEHRRLLEDIDPLTPPWRDAWRLVHAARPHEATVGLYDKAQWPGPPFTWDHILVSDDLAARVRDIRVDATSDASDHQAMMLELA